MYDFPSIISNSLPIRSSKNKIQCNECKGSGFVTYGAIICSICNGRKCVMCNSTGLSRMPYDTCVKCDGAGEIELSYYYANSLSNTFLINRNTSHETRLFSSN